MTEEQVIVLVEKILNVVRYTHSLNDQATELRRLLRQEFLSSVGPSSLSQPSWDERVSALERKVSVLTQLIAGGS